MDLDSPVVIVGAGPVGLIAALSLAQRGVRSIVVEQEVEATKWPKMDITNCRSMELLQRLGLADELRVKGVSQEHPFDVLFSTGFSDDAAGQVLARWDLPSPAQWRRTTAAQNDGTLPREAYQRCSQAVFETWLRQVCESKPEIQMLVGHSFQALAEDERRVTTTICEVATNRAVTIKSEYLIACDGAKSLVRKAIGVELLGSPLPMKLYLVHFRSKDLSRMHSQGRFWHIFYVNGGILISQDGLETFTVHLGLPLEADVSALDPYQVIYDVLGGSLGPYKAHVDEIIVVSTWFPRICIADRYRSKAGVGRVFLAGDSAHQNVPTGGYGMNTGLGDAVDISWKLAAVLQGHGGPSLLDSYEYERKPVAAQNIARSGELMGVHLAVWDWVRESSLETLLGSSDEKGLRARISKHYMENDGENKDLGTEMDYRFEDSPVVFTDASDTASPEWNARTYNPSTKPGHRAPHVLLDCSKETSIFDLYGLHFTVVDFSARGSVSKTFADAATRLKVPLKVVHLPDESHCRRIWERDAVLVRPDGFVAWRGSVNGGEVSLRTAILALEVATGRTAKNVHETTKWVRLN